jgi:CBS domain-containing protein
MTVLDALHEMHNNKYLHLPVVEEDGTVLGLVDVVEIMTSVGGSGGWRSFFSNTMQDDQSDTGSVRSRRSSVSKFKGPSVRGPRAASVAKMDARGPVQARLKPVADEDDDNSDQFSIVSMPHAGKPAPSVASYMDQPAGLFKDFVFKVTDKQGNTHRIKCNSVDALRSALLEKVQYDPASLVIKYTDDEGDEVVISADSDLRDAVDIAQKRGQTALKLNVEGHPPTKAASHAAPTPAVGRPQPSHPPAASSAAAAHHHPRQPAKPADAVPAKSNLPLIVGGAVAVAGIAATLALVLMRKK